MASPFQSQRGDDVLSIVIPTLNEADNLERLSAELGPQLGDGDEVIVVDGFSGDGTADVARRAGFRILRQTPLGIGLAKTEGGKQALNDVLVFLDADCHIPGGYLDTIRAHFRTGEVDAVGGVMRYSWRSSRERFLRLAYGELFFRAPRAIHRLTGKYGLPSNNVAIRREVFMSVGGYRAVVSEDLDLMLRLKPSKRVRYDASMEVEVSSRRFDEEGFFKTVLYWFASGWRLLLGNGRSAAGYRAARS